ncbi:hypothetical protein [Nocardia harenae]|uniref:hypothetical protein n=1 Tax=Nocardia harenae TaxID=358707 RepID=UPI0008303A05|nr:hypothetical protein [Nocardia harenae]
MSRPSTRNSRAAFEAATASPVPAEPEGVMVPVTDLPHLAEAARRRGEADRWIRVDATPAQVVRTPGRRPGQWLGSGAPVQERKSEKSSALAAHRGGNALTRAARNSEREVER